MIFVCKFINIEIIYKINIVENKKNNSKIKLKYLHLTYKNEYFT